MTSENTVYSTLASYWNFYYITQDTGGGVGGGVVLFHIYLAMINIVLNNNF